MSRKNTTCLLPKKGQQLRCHCGCLAVLRPAEEVCKPPFPGAMAYVCSNYPRCDSFVIADPVTKQPRGSLADSNLRRLRYLAHNQFDRLHQSGRMTRKEAYRWLAHVTQSPAGHAHIGHMGAYYCQVVIRESKKLLQDPNANAGRIRPNIGGEYHAAAQ